MIRRLVTSITAIGLLASCASTNTKTEAGEFPPPLPAGAKEAPAIAACRINAIPDLVLTYDECVESVTSDGTLILKPAVMTDVYAKLESAPHLQQTKNLTLTLAGEKSPSSCFPGPIVAYIGRGPSGVNLARAVAYFDNGPDYFIDGLARSISKAGKVGFIGTDLKTVVREAYDYATSFNNGISFACTGCHLSDTASEHPTVVGGEWSVLNRSGDVIIGPGLTEAQIRELQ